ncbi:hypothetical protein AADI24_02610 [Streptococcus pneumoniae]|uniref:hypothetical protein n=1 Tax=Streptococcus pneumoniae TaxID=1313 RepID=UPI0031CC893B
MSKNFSKENNIGVLIWARSTPKQNVFQEMINIVEKNYKKNIIFFVDDLCPQQVYNRSRETQNFYNEKYRSYFKSKNVKFYFSSQLVSLEKIDNHYLQEMIDDMTIKEYVTILPYKKHENGEFELSEVIHTIFQELLLKEALSMVSTILLGKFSQNLVIFHKKITGQNIETIIIERMNH